MCQINISVPSSIPVAHARQRKLESKNPNLEKATSINKKQAANSNFTMYVMERIMMSMLSLFRKVMSVVLKVAMSLQLNVGGATLRHVLIGSGHCAMLLTKRHGKILRSRKQGNNVAETLLQKQNNVSLFVAPGNTLLRIHTHVAKVVLNLFRNILLSQQMFPCLRAEETFRETMFPQQCFLVCGHL